MLSGATRALKLYHRFDDAIIDAHSWQAQTIGLHTQREQLAWPKLVAQVISLLYMLTAQDLSMPACHLSA